MTTIHNIRYALRQLRNAPGYTTTAVITLALCIGAKAAISSLIHAVLLQSLPVADPLTPGGAGIGMMQREYKEGLRLLMAISSVGLLIGCANLANLILVRGRARRAEISLRVAIGATRKRLVTQMLTESALIALLGAGRLKGSLRYGLAGAEFVPIECLRV